MPVIKSISDSFTASQLPETAVRDLHLRSELARFWKTDWQLMVRSLRRRYGITFDRAEDLVSQSVLNILQFYCNCPSAAVINITALFRRVLRNLAIDDRRSAWRTENLFDGSIEAENAERTIGPVTGFDLHQTLAATQRLHEVLRAVETLPEDARSLFEQRFVEEQTFRDIAIRLGISEATARKKTQRLREALARMPDESPVAPRHERAARTSNSTTTRA